MYSVMGGATHPGKITAPPVEASIGGINSISRTPNSDKVQINYSRVLPESVEGSINDKSIQDLLRFAAQNNINNSGARLGAVEALISGPDGQPTRQALTSALRYDTNPGVRLKALEGLREHVKDDVRVRNAVLEALLTDVNLGVRGQALHALEPVSADSSVRMALQQLAKEDPSDYIRTESQRELSSMPNLD